MTPSSAERSLPRIDRTRDSLIRLPEVRRRTGLSTASIYRKMDAGRFPSKVRLSVNIIAWYESDVTAWIAAPIEWRAAA